MRPPVPVPTLSRRAKLILGAIAVLLVLFTVIGTLTNVYVDYLWFDETKYTEVFWTELQTRALLFAVAGVATGGLVAAAIYLAYRFRPTFRPKSLLLRNSSQVCHLPWAVNPANRPRAAGRPGWSSATAATSARRTRSSASTTRS